MKTQAEMAKTSSKSRAEMAPNMRLKHFYAPDNNHTHSVGKRSEFIFCVKNCESNCLFN